MNKICLFFNHTAFLNRQFGIVPLMYGSLGLEYLTTVDLNADDIDILIPETFLNERWNEFQMALETEGYVLTDVSEHTFEKDGVSYSFAGIENLTPFAGIAMDEIEVRKKGDVTFRLLTLTQYLTVYLASEKDGYRVHERGKKDCEKIELIRKRIALHEQK